MALTLVFSLFACTPQATPESSSPVAAVDVASPRTATASGSAPAASAASAAPVVPLTAEEATTQIKVVSPTERELPLAARDAVLDELARALAKARDDAGKSPLHVFGVRADALLGKLGLENGDRFETLDGRSLATEPDAREAFSTAKEKKRFALGVQRRNATQTLVFIVKP